MNKLVIIFCGIIFGSCCASVNVWQSTSSIEIDHSANFVTNNKIEYFRGLLKRAPDATITGGDFAFDGGTFDDAGNKMTLIGDLNPGSSQRIVLDGNKVFHGERGTVVQSINVRGTGNRIEGNMQMNEDLVMQDSDTELICVLNGCMSENIILNGGSLRLEEDLVFADDVMVRGTGYINLNERTMFLGAEELTAVDDLFWEDARCIKFGSGFHLAATWTFSGADMFFGNGNTLWFDEGGNLILEPGTHLALNNIILRGLHGNCLRCLDDRGVLTLRNVTLILDEDFSFTTGALVFLGDCYIIGDRKFIYQSAQTSTVGGYTNLYLDHGVTLSFDPIWNDKFLFDAENMSADPWLQAKNFLAFEDATSKLILDGGSLFVTATGFRLIDGTLRVKDASSIACDLDVGGEGIILGNNDSEHDMILEIDSDIRLEVLGGALSYENVNQESVVMKSDASRIAFFPQTRFNLYQNFNCTKGMIEMHGGSVLAQAGAGNLLSSVHMLGPILYEKCTV